MPKSELKSARIAVWFDCICGVFSSIIALIGITFVTLNPAQHFQYVFNEWFVIGLTFWIGYLIFSFFLIGLGIYTWYREKHFDERKIKKKLKAPIVS